MIKKIGLWIITAAIFLATVEFAARVEDKIKWGSDLLSNPSASDLTTLDQLGAHSKFNAKFEKWKINRFGFRGPDVEIAKAAGLKRIMCLGASETLGLYEKEGKEYPAQLGTMLNARKPGCFQVVNAACPGTNVKQVQQLYSSWLTQFNPDIVFYYPSPVNYLDIKLPGAAKMTGNGNKAKKPFQLRIVTKANVIIKKQLPDYIQDYLKQRLIRQEVSRHPDGWVWETPPSERLDLFRAHLVELVLSVRKSGSELILLTHANLFSSKPEAGDRYQLTAWRKFYPRATESCLIAMERKSNDIIREVGREYQVPVVDIAEIVPRGPDNFADFTHLTEGGASKVASALEEAVLKSSP